MAMRIASRAPHRPLSTFNGSSKSFSRQISCSHRDMQASSKGTRRPFWEYDTKRIPGVGKHAQSRDGNNSRNIGSEFRGQFRSDRSPEPLPVEVRIDGVSHGFSPLILRDMCQCSLCVDSSTRQKQFATVDIPQEIRPKTVETDDSHVHITWGNDILGLSGDHTTSIPLQTLRNIVENGRPVHHRTPSRRIHWDVQAYTDETHDFDYEEYMNDDSVLFKALQQLETHGLMFVTNVPESEESVETVASRIGPLKTTFYGKTWDVRSVPEAKNVAYTSQNLGFHMDLMYMKQPPHLQLLHCIRSSAAGGASLFSDSFKAVQDLAEHHHRFFATLSRVPVTYHYDHVDHYYHQARPVIEQVGMRFGPTQVRDYSDYVRFKARQADPERLPKIPPMDFVEHVAWSPPFQGPFSLYSEDTQRYGDPVEFLNPMVRSWHNAAQKFNELIHRPEVVYERMMKPGECVIFDNRRVLHARKAFEVGDAGKERWLRGAYIDKDPFMSKLKVMTEQRGESEGQTKVESAAEPQEYFAAAAAS